MNRKLIDVCRADNNLQKQLLQGKITKDEFRAKKHAIHEAYSNTLVINDKSEKEYLKELIKKHTV